MRSLLLFIIVIITGVTVLANVVPLIGLLISLAIVYYSLRRFLLTANIGAKLGWGIVGLIGLSMVLSNPPAIIAVIVIVLLYYAYQHFEKTDYYKEEQDWMID